MLGANQIDKFEHLEPIRGMRQLLQLDLINNPISKLPGYREKIFTMFPSINILDTLDKGGKDAYTSASMVQAVSRVPDALFDKSAPVPFSAPLVIPPAPAFIPSGPRVVKTPRVTSKITPAKPTKPLGKDRGKTGKAKMSTPSKSTASGRAGLVFPTARIKRRFKESIPTVRIGKTTTIYTAAVLEYLTA